MSNNRPTVVLGLDPGSVRIGYGVIESQGNKLNCLAAGLLQSGRLDDLERSLTEIIEKFQPQKAGVEKLFFARNRKTALKVAESRGVLINALMKNNVPILEIAPSEVKLAVAGHGQASKEAVAKMVRYFLKLQPQTLFDDITDALAIAIAVSNRKL